MTSGLITENNLEKQMGCMAGFLQIFDRHHILTGKRLYSTKRLPPSPVGDTQLEKSAPPSPSISGDLGKPQRVPAPVNPAVVAEMPRLPLHSDGSRSMWKFSKEAPRLSLDSRATTDAKGGLCPKSADQQRSSPSVIAKLMGLEPLPNSKPESTPQLWRSASESRVSKDLFQSRFAADFQSHPCHFDNAVKDNDAHFADPRSKGQVLKGGSVSSTSQWRAPQPRKSFFDSRDVFPEPKQSVSIYGEIEKRLKLRGIDEPSKDLETLKHILEALQLKGLLHCKHPQQNQLRHRNFVYDDSQIVLIKPSHSTPINRSLENGYDYLPPNARSQACGVRRSHNFTGENSPSPSPRRERNSRFNRSQSPKTPSNANLTRSKSPVKPRSLNLENQRRVKEQPESRKASPVHSPKLTTRKSVPDRTPKSTKATSRIHDKHKITEDQFSSLSGSGISTSTDTEAEEGKNLLERCDKLLHSIAEMAATDMQPSPVSVLDSSFYKDESLTPSPVTTKRNIEFKDQYGELDDDLWSPVVSPIRSKRLESPDDLDLLYVSDILRASYYLADESDVFLLLEKQQYLKGNDTSKVSRLQRKLIFDTVTEILNRNKRLPPWKAAALPSLDQIWSEYKRSREHESGGDLFETICGVLKKDLAGDGINGWGDCAVEMSEAVLDMERLIFKDMISEIIGDLSPYTLPSSIMPRRKLVF